MLNYFKPFRRHIMQNKPGPSPTPLQPSLVDRAPTSADYEVMNHRVVTLERKVDQIFERLDAIEARLSVLERDVAVILATYVTKEYLAHALHALTWRLFGAFFGAVTLLVAAVFYIARYVAPPLELPPNPPALQAKPQNSQTR